MTRDIETRLAVTLPAGVVEGVATLRVTVPYAEAGRRMPGPAAHAITR